MGTWLKVSLFMRRNKRWFPFISATIVFFTFIINEVQRDTAKDLADALKRAEDTYYLSSRVAALHRDVAGIYQEIEELPGNSHLPEKGSGQEQFEYLRHVSDSSHQYDLILMRTELEGIQSLVEKIPEHQDLDDWYAVILKALDNSYSSTLDSHTLYQSGKQLAPSLSKELQAKQAADLAEGHELEKILHEPLESAKLHYTDAVLARAKLASKQADEASDAWKRGGWLLYGFGFVIGMIDKLYNKQEDASDTEG
jgi:hypothetical protein